MKMKKSELFQDIEKDSRKKVLDKSYVLNRIEQILPNDSPEKKDIMKVYGRLKAETNLKEFNGIENDYIIREGKEMSGEFKQDIESFNTLYRTLRDVVENYPHEMHKGRTDLIFDWINDNLKSKISDLPKERREEVVGNLYIKLREDGKL
jgi:hypothetical protein